MNHAQDPKDTLATLRELPPEVSLQQVEHMVAAFPLAMGAVAWLLHSLKFNLNTLVMTSSATLLVATSMYLFGGGASPKISDLHDAGQFERNVDLEVAPEELPAVVLDTPPTKPQSTPATTPPATSDTTPPNPALPPQPIKAMAPVLPAPTAPAPVEPLSINPPPASSPRTTDKERRFDLRGFTEIHLLSSVDATVEIGEFSVSATGREDLLELLDIRVQGNVLRISFPDGRHRFKGENDVHCFVRLPAVKALNVSGSGSITASTLPNTNSLKLSVLGSGHVVVGVVGQVNKLDLLVEGSGDISISRVGHVKELSMNVLASGNIMVANAEKVDSARSLLKGSGGIHARQMVVQGMCEVDMMGSGDVTLAGRTDVLNVLLQGSGSVDVNELKVLRSGEVNLLGSGDVYLPRNAPLQLLSQGTGTIHTSGSAGKKGSRGLGRGGE